MKRRTFTHLEPGDALAVLGENGGGSGALSTDGKSLGLRIRGGTRGERHDVGLRAGVPGRIELHLLK